MAKPKPVNPQTEPEVSAPDPAPEQSAPEVASPEPHPDAPASEAQATDLAPDMGQPNLDDVSFQERQFAEMHELVIAMSEAIPKLNARIDALAELALLNYGKVI